MERCSGLADLTLVNKYFPVANYSYPRNEAAAAATATTHGFLDPRSSAGRSSLSLYGSPPALVEDKSDSDASFDSSFEGEHNYEVKAAELWDSFWEPSHEDAKRRGPNAFLKKEYAFLTQAPMTGPRPLAESERRRKSHESPRATPWPLSSDAAAQAAGRNRKPAATYSAFPKPRPLPPRAKPASPSWESSRPREPPKRPARPEMPLELCIKPSTYLTGLLSPSSPGTNKPEEEEGGQGGEEEHTLEASSSSSSSSPPMASQRPSTSKETQRSEGRPGAKRTLTVDIPRPKTSYEDQRATSPADRRRPSSPHMPITPVCYLPTPPLDDPSCLGRRNRSPIPSELLVLDGILTPPMCPVHRNPSPRDTFTATNGSLLHPAPYIGEAGGGNGCCCGVEERRLQQPYSFFDDSDDDDNGHEDGRGHGGEEGSKAFFFRRLHKRSVSDLRRWRRSGDSDTSHRSSGGGGGGGGGGGSTSRSRTNTAPSSPDSSKRRGVFLNRMLGRRNS